MVVLPRSAEIDEAESSLSLALVALVVGTRPPVTPAMVASQLQEVFGLDGASFTVKRFWPDDFIVCFSREVDLNVVLSSEWPAGAPFSLRWRRWSKLIMASSGAFRYRILVAIRGIPYHARSLATVQTILGSSCAKPELALPEAIPDAEDERELFVAAWCAHPDLVPDEVVLAIPEPEEPHDGGPPLFLRP